jgi:Integrase core domain
MCALAKRTVGPPTEEQDKLLTSIFYNVGHPACYSSVEKLREASGVPKKTVQAWLMRQDTYTLHKPVVRKFKRNRYIVHNMSVAYEADLMDVQKYKSENDQVSFILILIDIFSKKVWVETLKTKQGSVVAAALKAIFKRAPTPVRLRTDMGNEFKCSSVQKLLKSYKISFSMTQNAEIKCACVERFIRTLRNKLEKYFTHFGVTRYVHVLQDLVSGYNKSVHSGTGYKPDDVNIATAPQVWENLYSGVGRYPAIDLYPKGAPKIPDGSDVRISKAKKNFEKGSTRNWSREVFKVKKGVKRTPSVYKLEDHLHEQISGTAYDRELQEITLDGNSVFKIREVLQTKGKGRNRKVLVAYEGWPDKFNSWLSESDIIAL